MPNRNIRIEQKTSYLSQYTSLENPYIQSELSPLRIHQEDQKFWSTPLEGKFSDCWYCGHSIQGIPYPMPVGYDAEKAVYRVQGVFCFFSCILSQILLEAGHMENSRKEWLTMMSRDVYGYKEHIRPINKIIFVKYGGKLEHSVYLAAAASGKPLPIIRVRSDYPFIPVHMLVEYGNKTVDFLQLNPSLLAPVSTIQQPYFISRTLKRTVNPPPLPSITSADIVKNDSPQKNTSDMTHSSAISVKQEKDPKEMGEQKDYTTNEQKGDFITQQQTSNKEQSKSKINKKKHQFKKSSKDIHVENHINSEEDKDAISQIREVKREKPKKKENKAQKSEINKLISSVHEIASSQTGSLALNALDNMHKITTPVVESKSKDNDEGATVKIKKTSNNYKHKKQLLNQENHKPAKTDNSNSNSTSLMNFFKQVMERPQNNTINSNTSSSTVTTRSRSKTPPKNSSSNDTSIQMQLN